MTNADERPGKKDGLENAAKNLVKWGGMVFRFFGAIAEEFTEPGGMGAIFVGAVIFSVGVVMSSDGYWQLIGGKPLLPWYESDWLGWGWLPGISLFPLKVWFGALASPGFWGALCFSCCTQIIQAYFFNGDAKKISKINPKMVGLLAWLTIAFDIALTFGTRNPLRYASPSDVFFCLMYNVLSIFAAELGRTVYKLLKG